MAEWKTVALTDEIEEDALHARDIGDLQIVVLRHEGRIHAVSRACPHETADLSRGFVDERRIHCPRHAASFDLFTGQVSFGWSCSNLKVFQAKEEEGIVFVNIACGQL